MSQIDKMMLDGDFLSLPSGHQQSLRKFVEALEKIPDLNTSFESELTEFRDWVEEASEEDESLTYDHSDVENLISSLENAFDELNSVKDFFNNNFGTNFAV